MLIRVVVFYALTLLFTVVLGGSQQAAAISSTNAILPQLAPGLAALLMLLIFRKDGHQLTIVAKGTPASRYALAALIPLGGGLVVYLLHGLFFGASTAAATTEAPSSLLIWFVIGAFGEELGWRGYLNKRLDSRLAGWASCLVVGVLWALWHVGMYQNGPLYMTFFVLQMVAYSVVIYALVADVGFSVLLATIFHLMINAASLAAYSVVNEVSFMALSSLLWAALAVIAALTKKPAFLSPGRA